MATFPIDYKSPTTIEKVYQPFFQVLEWADHKLGKVTEYLLNMPRLQFGYVKTSQGTKIITPDLSSVAISSETINRAYEEARKRAKQGKLESFNFPFKSQSDDLL